MEKTQFIFETGGYCTLCLDAVGPNASSKLVSGSKSIINRNKEGNLKITSFQSICEYLKVDLTKVFVDGIPLDYCLPNLEDSELKGTLCLDCAKKSEDFKTLFIHFKSIQKEIISCLKAISGKLSNFSGITDTITSLKSKMKNQPEKLSSLLTVERLQSEIIKNYNKIPKPVDDPQADSGNLLSARDSTLREHSETDPKGSSSSSSYEEEEGDDEFDGIDLPVDDNRMKSATTTSTTKNKFPYDYSSPQQCKNCEKTFSNSYIKTHEKGCMRKLYNALKRHRRPWCCNICNKRYRFRRKLISHRITAHGTFEDNGFPCPYCSFTFNSLVGREAHKSKCLRRHQKSYGNKKNTKTSLSSVAASLLNVTEKDQEQALMQAENELSLNRKKYYSETSSQNKFQSCDGCHKTFHPKRIINHQKLCTKFISLRTETEAPPNSELVNNTKTNDKLSH